MLRLRLIAGILLAVFLLPAPALGDVAKAFEQATGNSVKTEFGPSGLLRQRIEEGEAAHVFASANMAHPQTLISKGQKGPVALFARNNLCAIAQPDLARKYVQFILSDRGQEILAGFGFSRPE